MTIGRAGTGAVLRIESAYDVMGRLTAVTSYDAATGGSALNQAARAFNGFGQMTSERQAHTGLVDAATTAAPLAYSRPGNLTGKVRTILRLGHDQVPLHLRHLRIVLRFPG
jgi:hypothetical protein